MKDHSSVTSSRRVSKLCLFLIWAMCLWASVAFVSRASAQGFTLDAKFYDRDTGLQITSASAGTTVVLVATANIPANAAGAKFSVNALAKLKVVGITAPYKIPMANVVAPNTNPSDGGVIVQTGTQQGQFKIPNSTPTGSSIKVTAQATVAGQTSNTVTVKLTVR